MILTERRNVMTLALANDHRGRDILVALVEGPAGGDPWPYRVVVEWDDQQADTGKRTQAEAEGAFKIGLGYVCNDTTAGRRCTHFDQPA